jgi:xanthine dehydrogenase YagS FAD-binding subunit
VFGPTGARLIPLSEFFVLPEEDVSTENVLQAGDLVTEVVVPAPAPGTTSSYRKVRERGAWDFALASAAIVLGTSAGRVDYARIVLGGVAPIPWRSEEAEAAIVGQTLNEASARTAAQAATRRAEPMEQNGYKVALVEGIVEEGLLAFV